MKAPGALLASGRDADIFEYGPGLVLRRSREGRTMAAEARIMDFVRAQGYPVPAVEEVSEDGTDLVMERIEGPSMVAAMGRQPWTLRRQGAVLADLHRRLHEISAPDFLPAAPVGEGDRLLHLDLHPLNVILGPRGPVVIDWPNAVRGDPTIDVVAAWILLVAAEIPGTGIRRSIMAYGRSTFVRSFLGPFDRGPIDALLRDVVTWKVHNEHISPDEQAEMWRLVARVESAD